MAVGLVLFDVLMLLVALATHGVAVAATWALDARLQATLPSPLARWPLDGGLYLVVLLATVALLARLVPAPRPGRHRLMRSGAFYRWVFHTALRRSLAPPPLGWLLMTSNVLRFLMLRALGARVSPSASMSSDVVLLDPYALRVDAGATIGAQSFVSAHLVTERHLVVAPVHVGAGSLVGAFCHLGPGVTIGEGARLQYGVQVGPHVSVGAGARVDGGVRLATRARVGARARIGQLVVVRAGQVVPDGARLTSRLHRDERSLADEPAA